MRKKRTMENETDSGRTLKRTERLSYFFGVNYNAYTGKWDASVVDKKGESLKKHCAEELQAANEVRTFLQKRHRENWPDTKGYRIDKDFQRLIKEGWQLTDRGWEELLAEDLPAQDYFDEKSNDFGNKLAPVSDASKPEEENEKKYKSVYFLTAKGKWATSKPIPQRLFTTQEDAAQFVLEWVLKVEKLKGERPKVFDDCPTDDKGFFLKWDYFSSKFKNMNEKFEGTLFKPDSERAPKVSISLNSGEQADPEKYKWVCPVNEGKNGWKTYGKMKPDFRAATQDEAAQHVLNWVLSEEKRTGQLPDGFQNCLTDEKGYFLRESYSKKMIKAAASKQIDEAQDPPENTMPSSRP